MLDKKNMFFLQLHFNLKNELLGTRNSIILIKSTYWSSTEVTYSHTAIIFTCCLMNRLYQKHIMYNIFNMDSIFSKLFYIRGQRRIENARKN